MPIGELSRRTGVAIRLLRYYEEQGLLRSERLPSGHRRYDQDAPHIVKQIRMLLAAGLTTAVIAEIIPCIEGEMSVPVCRANLLRNQLDGLDEQIATLNRARSTLADLIPA